MFCKAGLVLFCLCFNVLIFFILLVNSNGFRRIKTRMSIHLFSPMLLNLVLSNMPVKETKKYISQHAFTKFSQYYLYFNIYEMKKSYLQLPWYQYFVSAGQGIKRHLRLRCSFLGQGFPLGPASTRISRSL